VCDSQQSAPNIPPAWVVRCAPAPLRRFLFLFFYRQGRAARPPFSGWLSGRLVRQASARHLPHYRPYVTGVPSDRALRQTCGLGRRLFQWADRLLYPGGLALGRCNSEYPAPHAPFRAWSGPRLPVRSRCARAVRGGLPLCTSFSATLFPCYAAPTESGPCGRAQSCHT